jgi:mono/diheme cytochrome c family protein
MRSATWSLVVALVVAVAGCGGEQAERQAAAPDSVALALAVITPATFDTVSWPSDSAAIARGAVVWTYSCRKCHGVDGSGNGGFVQQGDTVRPPTLLAPEWRLAGDRAAVREQIFTGTNAGMPHWGIVGLKPRDVDAAAIYIEKMLRW